MTRKREVPPSGGSQRGSRPQHAAPQTLRFKARSARSCRRQRGEAVSIASRAGAREGSDERRAGRLVKAAPAEAERTPPGRPARGHLGRCGGRPAARGDDGGAGLPRRSATALLSQASRRPSRRAVNPRAPPAAGSRTLRPPRPARATPESCGTKATVSQALGPQVTPSSGLGRRIPQLFTGTLHSEPGNSVCAAQSGVIASVQMEERRLQERVPLAAHLGVPGNSKHRGLSTHLPSARGHEYFRSYSRQTFISWALKIKC